MTGITLEDGTFTYDGSERSLAITGDLPDGTTLNYTDNTRTDAGTQQVTATITGDNHETLVLEATLTVAKAEITGITLEDDTFTYDGSERSLAITGDLP
ncbi:MBG domain-containing protein, partial [Parapedobacter soli]|uniref:MBG domain-containing protein n=1 Tax=Parapedobacter soli TaxID=416955 RepID=UPI0036F3C9D9